MSEHDQAPDALALQTRLIHDSRAYEPTRAVSAPIYQTSTWLLESPEDGARLAQAVAPPDFYTRHGSPNAQQAEALLSALEGAQAALVTASGMAAITSAMLAHLSAGDHVVAQRAHYAGTLALLERELPRLGVQVTLVDQTSTAAFEAALTPRTRVLYTETPTNPTMTLTDLEATARLARQHGALSITDNTVASSYAQRPLALGYDLVVHSATKSLNGHADVTAGALMGEASLVARVWDHVRLHGPILHPFEAWLLRRGLQTYTLRARVQNQSALELARRLAIDPRVRRVHYPGLDAHPQHDLARRQMTGGFGAMMAFEVRGGDQAALALIKRLRLALSSVSLGGMETLVVHPASVILARQSQAQRQAQGVEPGLVRLSVGCEDVEDLWRDLDQALATC